jgi:uncharacterized protein YndB with AHSA1/START domain
MSPESAAMAAYKRTMLVNVPIERAFKVFTEKMGAWWPASHYVGGTPFKHILIDRRTGGRWYEDMARSSEVSMEFVFEGPEKTRLEFEHRHLERHGAGSEKMRAEVGSDGGWPMILELYLKAAA